jgi:hypothetical protein
LLSDILTMGEDVMGINNTVLNGIRGNAYYYGIEPRKIEEFLTIPPLDFLSRQAMAIDIIQGIMTAHGKQTLLEHVVQLARVEHGIRQIQPWVRDHVVHALLSFLLGVFINEHFLKPGGQTVNPLQWKLAGLFHDVGYPVQIARDIIEPYTDQINKIKRSLSVQRPDVYVRVVPTGLDELMNGVNSLDLIQERLNRWNLNINARDEYTGMVDSGRVCHGIISSLSVLYVLDMMYQKYNPQRDDVDIHDPSGINWNQSFFENDVVPACAAIFVHNLSPRCFRSTPLDRHRAALPYLLRLSDCLQDWERPSAEYPMGLFDCDFDISTPRRRLVFRVDDADRRDRIRQEIASAISDSEIEILG